MYFILYVWKQLGFDSVQDELHLSGDIPDKDWNRCIPVAHQLVRGVGKGALGDSIVGEINKFVADFNRAPITAIEGLPYDLMTLFVRGIKDSNR